MGQLAFMNIPQLLIFDLDGTLIDSRADLATAVNFMRGHFGLEPLALTVVQGYIGDGVRKLVERSLQGTPVDMNEALRINRDFYYANLTKETVLYDGVESGLRSLAKAGHSLGVLTNKPGDPSRKILSHFGLIDLFCGVIGGGDGADLKPEPTGIFRLMEQNAMTPETTWMVGDHCTDLAAAENAGVKSAYVSYGFGEPREHKPTAYFASFSELVEYLLKA